MTQEPKWGLGRLILKFLAHTYTYPVGLLAAEAATCTAHDKHNRRTLMPSVAFELAIPTINRLQTYALDRTATEIGTAQHTDM